MTGTVGAFTKRLAAKYYVPPVSKAEAVANLGAIPKTPGGLGSLGEAAEIVGSSGPMFRTEASRRAADRRSRVHRQIADWLTVRNGPDTTSTWTKTIMQPPWQWCQCQS